MELLRKIFVGKYQILVTFKLTEWLVNYRWNKTYKTTDKIDFLHVSRQSMGL